jgi:hypothetical protein
MFLSFSAFFVFVLSSVVVLASPLKSTLTTFLILKKYIGRQEDRVFKKVFQETLKVSVKGFGFFFVFCLRSDYEVFSFLLEDSFCLAIFKYLVLCMLRL